MSQPINKWLYWTPRVLTILFLAFLTLFSLDVIEEGRSVWEIALGMFMHNLPVMVLAVVLWISWKRELVGAVVFALIGLLFGGRLLASMITSGVDPQYLAEALFGIFSMGVPPIAVSVLFFLNWRRKKDATSRPEAGTDPVPR